MMFPPSASELDHIQADKEDDCCNNRVAVSLGVNLEFVF